MAAKSSEWSILGSITLRVVTTDVSKVNIKQQAMFTSKGNQGLFYVTIFTTNVISDVNKHSFKVYRDWFLKRFSGNRQCKCC